MQPNTPKRHREDREIDNVVTRSIQKIQDMVSGICNTSPFTEFIIHPGRFMSLLSEEYKRNPNLKKSTRLKRI